MSVEKVRTE